LKNQYFADRNDYFKYDLAIFLCEQLSGIKRFTFIPMLTINDGSGDGGLIDYRQGAGRSDLYRFLRESIKKKRRQVSRLREYFGGNGFQFEYRPYGDDLNKKFTHEGREAYFKDIPDDYLKHSVLLLDPDNGLEIKSCRKGNYHKFVKYDEVKLVYDRMDASSILTVYQHLPFLPRPLIIYSLINKLREELKSPIPLAVSDGQIAFLMVTKNKKRQKELEAILHDYLRLNLTLFD
jgi:hypothetical protein